MHLISCQYLKQFTLVIYVMSRVVLVFPVDMVIPVFIDYLFVFLCCLSLSVARFTIFVIKLILFFWQIKKGKTVMFVQMNFVLTDK